MRQLRLAVGLTQSVIAQGDLSPMEARAMVAAARDLALRLFPETGTVFDLVYLPRLRRLLAERYGPALRPSWSAN